MIYLQFFAGFLIYCLGATITYHPTFKSNPLYFPAGIALAIIGNFLWLNVAKSELNSDSLLIKALIWDAILMMVYLIIPIVFFSARFTTLQAAGIALTVIGLGLTKL